MENYLKKKQELREITLTQTKTMDHIAHLQKTIEKGQELDLRYAQKALFTLIPAIQNTLENWCDNKKSVIKVKFIQEILLPKQQEWESNQKGVSPFQAIAESISVVVVNKISAEQSFIGLGRMVMNDLSFKLNINFNDREALDKDFMTFILNLLHRANSPEVQEVFIIEQQRGEYFIRPTEKEMDNILRAQNILNQPVDDHKPMICKPNHHKSLIDNNGGYLIQSSPLIKHPTTVNGKIVDSIKNFDNQNYLDAINRIQDTAYEVNHKLLEVLAYFYSNGMFFKDYPTRIEQCLTKHVDEAKASINQREQRRKKWAAKNGEVYLPLKESTVKEELNKAKEKAKGEVRQTQEIFKQAQFYLNEDCFYYPVFVDLRGRIYPYSNYGLSYQGNELSKALVHLHNKEALTPTGLKYLYQTLGNAMGADKQDVRTKEKVAKKFFKDNAAAFMNGNFNLFITHQDTFDEPITAIAIVLELVEYYKDNNYATGIICHRDARCSGASIVGTLMDCSQTMELTSLIETSTVNGKLPDAYMTTANRALQMAMDSDDSLAKALYENDEVKEILFNRNAFKKAVMTKTSYGLTDYSLRLDNQSIFDEFNLMGSEEDGGYGLTIENKKLYDLLKLRALKEAMPACYSYLNQIKEVATLINENKDSVLEYINPLSGFPITRLYENMKKSKLNINNGFKKMQVVYYEKSGKADKMKSVNAFAPNLIHSLDAGLLIFVRNELDCDLVMIHDSIGSHPNHVDEVIKGYQKGIVELHQNDILEQIIKSMGVDYTVEKIGDKVSVEHIFNSEHSLT